MSDERLYPIGVHCDFGAWASYYPGVTPSGEQVIVFQNNIVVTAYRFSAAGNYLGHERRTVADGRAGNGRAGAMDWAATLGLTPATIRVKWFYSTSDGGPSMWIEEYPYHFGDGSLAELTEDAHRRWDENGCFVLNQGTSEHWIDGNGEHFQ